jgi:molecular chaperone GrpE
VTDMEKETVADEILEETEQEAAEDMSQEQTDAQAAENQPDDKDVQTDDKKRFFGKKKDKKDKQIEDLTAQLDDLRKRNLAEFENFRKRTEKEKSTMFDMGAKSVLEKLLPIIDNFERGFAGLSEEQMSDPFVSGMDMVYKQLVKALADMGVEPIEAVGKPFDPNLHNAVMHVEDENLGENTVAQEFQKGYLYHGSVVRHSMVQVAN